MFMPGQNLKVFVKNISADAFVLPELGGYALPPGEEINMCDDTLPNYYRDPQAVLRAINDLTGTSLYVGVHGTPKKLEYRIEPDKRG
jgi:hypothetical protein